MSSANLAAAQAKMRHAAVSEPAIEAFSHYYRQLVDGATGLIGEDTIEPLLDPPALHGLQVDPQQARDAVGRTVVIKLNGGLGTSMGMDRAKSLLPVRDGLSFLDLTVEQLRRARARYAARLPLVLMNSFRTSADSLAALAAYPDLPVADLPLQVVQSQEPKLRADDLSAVSWPADPSLEWCPPGHGDLYPTLLASGLLPRLLDHGFRYASVSNSDNLGAVVDARLAGWFAASKAPYAAEVCVRTPADRKGGHLARRRSDGRVILREIAQTAAEDHAHFQDEQRHGYFHTNNLWFDLQVLHRVLQDTGGVLGLPLIRNTKTVDPADPSSPAVIQIETAMGAAIESFEGALPILVGRDRFLPVKTTNDLLVLRSDAYELDEDARPRLVPERAPAVSLDSRYYTTITDFESRFPVGVPSLVGARSLSVRGDWTFGSGVVVTGDAVLGETESADRVPDQARL